MINVGVAAAKVEHQVGLDALHGDERVGSASGNIINDGGTN